MNYALMKADLEKATASITRVVGSGLVEPKAISGQAPEIGLFKADDPVVRDIARLLRKALRPDQEG